MTRIIHLSDTPESRADIELFVRAKFRTIVLQKPWIALQSSTGEVWPSEGDIVHIVEKSSGHFIYAATAMRYIFTGRADPARNLSTVLNLTVSGSDNNPFATLDALYLHILLSVTSGSTEVVKKIFEILLHDLRAKSCGPCGPTEPRLRVTELEHVLFLSPGLLYYHLEDLHSVMQIPDPIDGHKAKISFLHASFGDFLRDPNRSQQFHIAEEEATANMCFFFLDHILLCCMGGHSFCHINLDALHPLLKKVPLEARIKEGLETLLSEDIRVYTQYLRWKEEIPAQFCEFFNLPVLIFPRIKDPLWAV
jgi:hypothetical protein